jgi:glutamate-1-semialdehyde 2,1-aminomutase/spore coat polysaccharide biosynthesis protein SpsF
VRIAALVQARLSSRRFPGKVLAEIGGLPAIVYLCRRLQQARQLDAILVATSEDPSDDPLADTLAAHDIPCYRGALEDVLGRMLAAARSVAADACVRITGDCPLIDPDLVDAMVTIYRGRPVDYYSNISPRTYPDGMDTEIISMDALERAAAEATRAREREHVTPYLREHPERFTHGAHLNDAGDYSCYRLCVDEEADLAMLQDLLAQCGDDNPRLPALVAALVADPALAARSRIRIQAVGGIADFIAERRAGPAVTASDRLWARGAALIPAGTQTLSKGPTQFVRGFAPKYLVRGEGCHVWDADGNRYVDYPMGLGAVTLGHAHPEVCAAVAAQLREGNAFSLMHPLEVEVAERICAMVPCAEQVRFGKNGSDATSACIRAARALTGRDHVARCGYHGWHDWALDASHGVRRRGVPAAIGELTHAFSFNDPENLREVLRRWQCAAIILEPAAATAPERGFLEAVRELADESGAVLIFDEIITGFRYARGGAQEYFGVTPDLASMGKGVANGLPLSVACGGRRFMSVFEDVFFSLTFGGEATALAAAKVTLEVMEREDYWSHVWRQGARLQQAYRALAEEFRLEALTDCAGLPPWTVVSFTPCAPWSALQLKTLFQQEMIRQGILFSGSQFLSLAHDDTVIGQTIAAYREALRVVRYAIDEQCLHLLLEGEVNEPVFRSV